MKLLYFLCVLAFMVPKTTFGDETIRIGDKDLKVPMPEGFVRFDGARPDVDSMMAGFLPATNRLVLTATPPEVVAKAKAREVFEMKRYLMVQTFRQAEGSIISDKEFAEVRQVLAKQFLADPKVMESIRKSIDKSVKDAKLPMKVGEPKFLGVYEQGDRSLDCGMLVKMEVEKKESTLVAGVSFAVVNGKMLYLYVYSSFDSAEDIEWTKKSIKAWRESITAANKQ